MKKTSEGNMSQWFKSLLLWREKHISQRAFVLMLAFLIGLCTALCATLLKETIHHIQAFWIAQSRSYNFLYLLLPVIGILITALLVRYVIRDDIGHGVTKILLALSQRKSRIKPHNMWSSMLASSITIGFGGSVGAESPIVLTGAAIGSNIGRLFRQEQKMLMLLVGCGAAGAIAGIFKAPITGLVFVVEVLLMDFTLNSILPLLVSSVTSAAVSYIIGGTEAMFHFSQTEPFSLDRIPFAILLGILCGLLSLYFSKMMFMLEGRMKGIRSYTKRFLISALILSGLIFLFPSLYGEGYITIERLINGNYATLMEGSLFERWSDSYWLLFVFLGFSVLFKVYASVATNSGGGCGGLFAPSLFVGGLTGFMFAYAINFFGFIRLPHKNFTLMGMAGVMAAVMHAPLTGIFLIAELTGGYDLFLPLMMVSISAYATIRIFMPHSIYSLRLAKEGKLLTHQKDKAVLRLMSVDSVVETEFEPVMPQMTLGDMVQVIGKSTRNVFPVVDEEGILLGVVLLDNIRNIMFRPELYDRFKVEKFMVSPPAKINNTQSMEDIMRIFDDTQAWNLPVIDTNGHYLGFISKSKVFNSYRTVLVETFEGD
ncbi:chloride channel protein [Porphyromonas crevioricanis]|nr:chloride channel protein [Porphyromonas crevioricanis]GAD05368.1 chloride channel protein [Porphyromonas crevioricanis JCM 15906]SJZ85403.1 chloride channel protein, CIC family [Porphyromonas crevioricanis]